MATTNIKTIAFIGVDGSGKTTLINRINRLIIHEGIKPKVFHLRPGLLPPPGVFIGKSSSETTTNPHASKQSGYFVSVLRISYLFLDYVLGYLVVIFPLIYRKKALVIFDRYAYDLLIDPRRFRINLPKIIIQFFIYFVPKPDLTILLCGNPVEIHRRKQEVSIDETVRQIERINHLSLTLSMSIVVSTTENNIETCAHLILNKIGRL